MEKISLAQIIEKLEHHALSHPELESFPQELFLLGVCYYSLYVNQEELSDQLNRRVSFSFVAMSAL